MKTEKIKPTKEVKALLPLDVDNDRELTYHYRIRRDGSVVYTNGSYMAITPPDETYLEIGEQIKRVDGVDGGGVRLPDAEQTKNAVFDSEYFLARYKAVSAKISQLAEEEKDRLPRLADEAVYYFEKAHNPVEAEMVLDAGLLGKLAAWFARHSELPGRLLKVSISRDNVGERTQLQIRGLAGKRDKNLPYPEDGYQAFLMGCRE